MLRDPIHVTTEYARHVGASRPIAITRIALSRPPRVQQAHSRRQDSNKPDETLRALAGRRTRGFRDADRSAQVATGNRAGDHMIKPRQRALDDKHRLLHTRRQGHADARCLCCGLKRQATRQRYSPRNWSTFAQDTKAIGHAIAAPRTRSQC